MKPGYRTSEFWVAVLVAVGSVVAALADALPPKWAAIATAASAAAYQVSRGLAKVTPPKDSA